MAKKTEEEILVAKLRKTLNKAHAKEIAAGTSPSGEALVTLLSEGGRADVREACPSGLLPLDRYVLGVGGMAYGRIMEISGAEGGGKTSLLNRFLAGCQRDGGTAVLGEAEHKYDPTWAQLHGLDLSRLVVLQPDCLEQWLEMTENLILQKTPGRKLLMGLDSVAALPPRRAVTEGLTGDAAVAEEARIWSRAMKHLPRLCGDNKVALILNNQIRMKIGTMYGNPETTPGGNAIKFHAAIRMNVNYGKMLPDRGGRFMHVQCMKNNLCPPFRRIELKLSFTEGFDERWAVLNHAKEVGCVEAKCRSVKEALAALGWQDSALDDAPAEEKTDEAAQSEGAGGDDQ